ncbi:hypothetical protein Tco_1440410 [Tanacetum coccineum]
MTLSPSSFYKRYISSYETPSPSSSPTPSPTLLLQKSSKSEEAASEDQQQQAVPVEDTTVDEPLGLGYGATRRRALELAETTDETTTPRLPVHTTWEDPMDGIVYTNIKYVMPLLRAPVQTRASPEWSSGSLPISPASLTIPTPVASPVPTTAVDALPPTLFKGYGRDFTELFARSGVHTADQREIQELRERVAILEQRMEHLEE